MILLFCLFQATAHYRKPYLYNISHLSGDGLSFYAPIFGTILNYGKKQTLVSSQPFAICFAIRIDPLFGCPGPGSDEQGCSAAGKSSDGPEGSGDGAADLRPGQAKGLAFEDYG